MADSPGKVLSSFSSSNEKACNNSEAGGCAGIFFQLLDRLNGKKFFPHKFLPSERPKHNSIGHTEEKLPMAKLLLIADEKRIAASKREKEPLSDGASQRNENVGGQRETTVSVVAKLMGLETMPFPQLSTEQKQVKVLKEKTETQSARKPLQSKKVPVKRAQRNTKAMDIRMETQKRATKSSHREHLCGLEAKETGSISVTDTLKHPSMRSKLNVKSRSCEIITQMNMKKGEDPRTFIFSTFSLPSMQMESQLRSILSPSRTSNKLLSPVKSPLSSKSAACLFGAAARVLEPNLRPARHPGFSPRNVHITPDDCADEDNTKQNSTSIASKRLGQSIVPFTECQGHVTNKCIDSIPEKMNRLSPNHATGNRYFNAKDGVRKNILQVKHEKRPNKILTRKNQSLASDSCKLEANDPTLGECRLITSSAGNKNSATSTQIDNKKVNMLVTQGNSKRQGSLRGQEPFVPPGASSAKCSNHDATSQLLRVQRSQQFSRIARSQQLSSSSHNLAKNMVQEGNRDNFKVGSANDGKATRLGKTDCTGDHYRTNVLQKKRESSCSRSSSKRKASTLSVKPTVLSNVARGDAGDCKLQNVENEKSIQSLTHEMQSMIPQSDSNALVLMCLDDCNMTSSTEADSRGPTRVRARWDVADERKKNLTMNHLNCSNSNDQIQSPCSSVINNFKRDVALETNEAAASLLQERLLSLDASTLMTFCPQLGTHEHNPSFCSDGSEIFHNCSIVYNKGQRTNINDCSSNIDSYLVGAKQESRRYDSISAREDQDSESISGSFCPEGCEQPSPISILESPFHDSGSCSSDSFEAPQGLKLWEAMQNEKLDYVSTVTNHIEDVESHVILMDVSDLHCIDSQSLDADARSKEITEHGDTYVKKILDTGLHSAEFAVWERLALSGPFIDLVVYHQIEENYILTPRARMHTGLCKEFDHERDQCYTRMHTTLPAWCEGAAPQQRSLFCDCIEVALKLCLEVAMQSYGFLVPCMWFPSADLQKAVHKQIGEWKELAFSMNLDDMMKVEIKSGMGRWFKYGDEVEIVAANVEAVIFNSLIDELAKDVQQDAQACFVCS